MTKTMVTLDKIAEICEVSRMTAYRALHPQHSKMVQEQTRVKVKSVADKLCYRPNLIVKTLQTGKSHLIGILLDTYNAVGDFMEGFHSELFNNGYDFIFVKSNQIESEKERILQSFVDRRLDGVFVIQANVDRGYEHIFELYKHRMPIVAIDCELPIPCGYVGTDNFQAAYDATSYLIELGHENILLLGSYYIRSFTTNTERTAGYRKAMEENGLNPLPEYFVEKPSESELGFRQISELLKRHNRPTAIVAMYDVLAAQLMSVALHLGLKLPQDLSVIGFSDSIVAKVVYPSLTSVSQDFLKISKVASELMLKLVNSKKIDNLRVVCPAKLIVRESTVPLKK